MPLDKTAPCRCATNVLGLHGESSCIISNAIAMLFVPFKRQGMMQWHSELLSGAGSNSQSLAVEVGPCKHYSSVGQFSKTLTQADQARMTHWWACRTVKVKVAGETKLTPTGTGRDASINERLEFVLSGSTAQDANALIEIEVWDFKWINDRKGSKKVRPLWLPPPPPPPLLPLSTFLLP